MADESRVKGSSTHSLQFVGLGEVLFDVFEDGAATLGGAPLNVAVHTHQMASALGVGEGVVVSRVGNDPSGEKIRESLLQRGMSTRYVQTDPVHGTGVVSVFMRHGEPGYQIESDAAWDFLEPDPMLDDLASSCDAVCFGSLAQRSSHSSETIRRFVRQASHAVRLYDVNLRRNTLTREPGYSPEILEASCEIAGIVKVNWSELLEVAELFEIRPHGADENLARMVMKRLSVSKLIVTSGAQGTTLYVGDNEFRGYRPLPIIHAVHPVGAGDACTAGILFGMVSGLSPDAAVDLGNKMGAWVASHRTATPMLSDDILRFLTHLAASHSTYEGDLVGENV